MNESQKRILVGIVAGSALSLTLGMTARAEEPDLDTTGSTAQLEETPKEIPGETEETQEEVLEKTTEEIPEETPEEAPEETPDETPEETPEETSDETPEETPEEAPEEIPEETSDETPEEIPEETPEENTGNPPQEAAGEETPGSYGAPGTTTPEANKNIQVDGFDLRKEDNASAGWDEENKSGWRFDGSAVCMVNNAAAVDVRSKSGNVSLSVAGFNRISTLYANGDVNITGSGILLIDSIDMLAGKNLNLLTNTDVYEDGTGSAAVFLKNESGEYVLINGSVSGLLDEEYTLPEGITLVVPEGGVLDMRVTTTVKTQTTITNASGSGTYEDIHYGFTEEDAQNLDAFAGTVTVEEEGTGEDYYKEEVHKELSFSAPVLNIGSGALLRLEEGSRLMVEAFRFQQTITSDFAIDAINTGTLNVQGTLELGGEILATNESDAQDENFLVKVEGSIVSGQNGKLTNATVIYDDGAGKQDTLNLAGNSYVKASGSGIGQLNVSGPTTVVCDDGASIGGVAVQSGGLVRFAGTQRDARYEVGNLYGQYAVDSGYLTANGGHGNEVFSNPGGSVGTGAVTVRTSGFRGNLTTTPQLKYWTGTNTAQGPAAPQEWTVDTLNYTEGQQVSFDSLYGNAGWGGFGCYEVYTYDSATGLVQLHLLKEGSGETLDAGQILEIRGVDFLNDQDASITVDGQYLKGTVDSGWNGGSGWRYNANTITMVNNGSASAIYAEAAGLELNVAGLNRIGLLYADGDVNITGSGILLIDSIDLLYGQKLNLLTNTDLYENGSAAVFLKNASGAYELINGSIPGILDEEYTIPEGVTLVMPDGTVLELRVTATVKDSSGKTQTGYGMSQTELAGNSPSFSVPVLNIGKNATLKVENGAQLRLDAFRFREGASGDYSINTGTLKVAGLLDLAGSITRFGSCAGAEDDNLLVRVENGGRVTGSGSLTDATVIYAAGAGSQDTLNVSGKSYVQAGSNGIGTLNVAGETTVICTDGARLGTVTVGQGGKLLFAATERTNRYYVDTLTGSYSVESGYLIVDGSYAGDHASLTAPTNPIPVEMGTLEGKHVTDVSHLDYWTDVTLPQIADRPTNTGWKSTTIKYTDGGSVDYDTLHQLDNCAGYAYYEVYTREDGELKLHLLREGSTESVALANIVKILAVDFSDGKALENGIYVDDQKLSGSGSNGWTAGSGSTPGSGWRYDGSSVSLVNNAAPVDIQSVGQGVNLSVAGLNLVGVLHADEDVNITGTGLILIDRIDLADGKKLNLKTNTDVYQDGEGSAAVFLYDQQTGVYRLINGTVPGILDERYTIPDGVTLVVPQGGVLDMRVIAKVTTTTTTTTTNPGGTPVTNTVVESHFGVTEEEKSNLSSFEKPQTSIQGTTTTQVYRTISFSASELTISGRACLRLEQGAEMKMQAFEDSVAGSLQRSTLKVNGKLELEGAINGTTSTLGVQKPFLMEVNSGGHVTGSGTLSKVLLRYAGGSGDVLNISGSGSFVDVQAGGIKRLTTTGNTELFYSNGAAIGSIVASGEGKVTFFAKEGPHDHLEITDSITGAYDVNSGFVSVGGNLLNENFDSIKNNAGKTISVEKIVDGLQIGYVTMTASRVGFHYSSGGTSAKNLDLFQKETTFTGTDFSYSGLRTTIGSYYNEFEIYTYDAATNRVAVQVVTANSSETVDGSRVFLIRGILRVGIPTSEFGGSSISPGTSNTGSGILGGEGAGSLNGGKPNSVLNGNRIPDSSGSGSVSNTDTSNTGSGILVGGGTLNGGNAGNILDGSGSRPEAPAEDSGDISGTNTSNTGSGVLGGGGSLNGGSAVSVLTGSRKPAETAHQAGSVNVELRITGSGTEYRLAMYYNGLELKQLGEGTVAVSMEVQLRKDWNPEDLFVVFWDENGEMVVIRARFDPETGLLEFDAPRLGDFRLVSFHWEGTDYTAPEFLEMVRAHLNE